MLFSSTIFLFAFLPICLAIYYLIPTKKMKAKNIFLLCASLGFYAWGEPLYVVLMLISITANYVFALLIDINIKKKIFKKSILLIMLIFNLAILGIFKYADFLCENINYIFHVNVSVPNIVLPIGISFFTFQAISYVLDVYRKVDLGGNVVCAQRNPINVGLYISLFPQLIAGPIVRYRTVALQINNRKENITDFSEGVRRFIIGLGKKVLIANNVALIADKAFSMQTSSLTTTFAWLGAISYSLQIFFDFSGYSDMAIGLGKMFGFHFSENFNYPYVAKSISEFWRRWHISLGSWFRDYLYIPLGGSRKGNVRTIFNLFVVWLLTGFWHGANWTFIFWGLYYFSFIAIEKILKIEEIKKWKILRHSYTIVVVIVGWVIFRANSLHHAKNYLFTMLGLRGESTFSNLTLLYLKENIFFLMAGLLFSIPIFTYATTMRNGENQKKIGGGDWLYNICKITLYIAMFIIAVSFIVKGSYNPFIYFNF